MKKRFLNFWLLCLSLCAMGFFSCIGGETGTGGGSGDIGGSVASVQNAGSPENPPNTVSLDPNCKKGAKPDGDCKGSPLPASAYPCSSNLTVVKNLEQNIWWCACPEGTQEMKDSEGKSKCVCPSGEGLMVNVEKGESLGCLRAEVPVEIQRERNLCPSGLVQLEEKKLLALTDIDVLSRKAKKVDLKNEELSLKPEAAACGCPTGTQLWKGSGALEGQQGCQCPSGQLLPVDSNTGKATKSCEELSAPCRPGLVLLMPVSPGHVNFCGCPAGTEFVYPEGGGAALGCKCPSGARVQVDPQSSEMIGSCAINL